MRVQAEEYIKKGNDYALQGKNSSAAAMYKKAIALEADNVLAWGNLGVVQEQMGKNLQAEKSIKHAVALAPDYAKGFYNLGMLMVKMRRAEESIQYLEKAVELSPEQVEYVFNQGVNLQKMGKINEQIESFEKVAKMNPDYPEIYYWLWLAYRRIARWEKISSIELMLEIGVEHDPFINIVRSEDVENNFEVAKFACKKLKAPYEYKFFKKKRDRLKIGYFSNDLRDHPVGQMVSGMFELHDRGKFEVVAFCTEKNDGSEIYKRIVKGVDEFVDLSDKKMTDEQMAKIIFEKKIDILVEMTGHTKDNHFAVCGYKPAPIIVEWLGFPGTTGADFVDYALVDTIVVPESEQKHFTEKLAHLPSCYQVNTPMEISKKKYRREDFGLPENGFVLSSFNQVYKIDSVVWDLWMRILKRVPGSVLWLWGQHPECVTNLKKEAEKRGVDPERIIFSKSEKKPEHLARLRLSDLGLDTLIYGGHTTTTDCLWAGVPVVTKMGDHFASRVCASILTEVGLPELVTNSLEDYENMVVSLASDRKQLNKMRMKLTHERLKTNLFDTKKFVNGLEEVYQKMWESHNL